MLAGRLRVAIENASGYALDDLDDEHDHSESSFSTSTSPQQGMLEAHSLRELRQ